MYELTLTSMLTKIVPFIKSLILFEQRPRHVHNSRHGGNPDHLIGRPPRQLMATYIAGSGQLVADRRIAARRISPTIPHGEPGLDTSGHQLTASGPGTPWQTTARKPMTLGSGVQ
jgi:hypothetical protein